MSQSEQNSPAVQTDAAGMERCGNGLPVRYVCPECLEECGRPMLLDEPAPASPDADVLAYLARRQGNAERVARVTAETDELHVLARDRARQLAVLIDEIRAGLHHGEAAAQAAHTGFAAEGGEA